MSIRGRLNKLERETGSKAGRCPGCGFRPGDIRTIETRLHPQYQPGEPLLPMMQLVSDDAPQPGRPRCVVCGGYMPPIAFIDARKQNSDGTGQPEL